MIIFFLKCIKKLATNKHVDNMFILIIKNIKLLNNNFPFISNVQANH